MNLAVTTFAVLTIVSVPVAAGAATNVPGSANPNPAGRDAGYTCCGTDAAPLQSPPELGGIVLQQCASLHFDVTGQVSYLGVPVSGNNPDGDDQFDMTDYGDGISAPTAVRTNALLGVFLTSDSPTGQETPGRLDYSAGIGFVTERPRIGQIFFIGDGLTSDSKLGQSNGGEQSFVVPPGATRLFLGTADGFGWGNNRGSFTVSATSTPEVRQHPCGDAQAPSGITAGDSLLVLKTAVGSAQCNFCVCDVDDSGMVLATDALIVLRKSVGLNVDLRCACCEAPV